jgi:hypothetical protein
VRAAPPYPEYPSTPSTHGGPLLSAFLFLVFPCGSKVGCAVRLMRRKWRRSRCRCGRGEPSPSADVARGEPNPGADVVERAAGTRPDRGRTCTPCARREHRHGCVCVCVCVCVRACVFVRVCVRAFKWLCCAVLCCAYGHTLTSRSLPGARSLPAVAALPAAARPTRAIAGLR